MPNDFNPDTFLQTDYNDSAATTYTPVPEGEYTALISPNNGVKARRMEKDGNTFFIADVLWELDDPNGTIKEATGRDKNTVRQSLFLDMTDAGHLDFGKGKNVPLGRLREALGQNDAGKPWNFNMLVGKAAKVKIKHRTDQNGAPISNVTEVTKL